MSELDRILADGDVTTHFQPIVDLDSGLPVGYEALSRGPAGPLQRPDLLFAAARSEDRLTELDELCRRLALRNGIAAGVRAPLWLFVNIEPDAIDDTSLAELVQIADSAPDGLNVMLEVTERALAARPAELLAVTQRLRCHGWRIALDDVGADDLSLTLMPLIRPDVVKLDLSLVQRRPDAAIAEIVNAVNAYAEESGAVLLAEGIETAQHLQIARALGARLGQGWLFGRPSPVIADQLGRATFPLSPVAESGMSASPFGCLPAGTPLRTSTKPLLIELSKHLEREALRLGSTCLVIATFQHAHQFTPRTAQRYTRLLHSAGFVAALGHGLSSEPLPGLRGADLAADDPLIDEWDLIVLSPHFSAALLARDIGDAGCSDLDRQFRFALTYRRETVIAAAAALMSRVVAQRSASALPSAAVGSSPTLSPVAAVTAPPATMLPAAS